MFHRKDIQDIIHQAKNAHKVETKTQAYLTHLSANINIEKMQTTNRDKSLNNKKKAMLSSSGLSASLEPEAAGASSEKVSDKKILVGCIERAMARLNTMKSESYVCSSTRSDKHGAKTIKIYYGSKQGKSTY